MSELKTLKDIRYNMTEGYDSMTGDTLFFEKSESGNHVDLEDLRSEAIKWVKEMKKKSKLTEDLENLESCERSHGLGFIFDAEEFLEHFFNITEEELK